MNENYYVAIMAGGIGSRFWPMSRQDYPKQFLDILNTGKTLIQSTYDRFARFIPAENIYVVTADQYKNIVARQLPELPDGNILCEPSRKNTAPCVAYISYKLQQLNPDANLICAPSDHLILDEEAFKEVCTGALKFTSHIKALVTLGIKPTYPNTGYGYIQYEQHKVDENVYKVKTFTEKPDLELAKTFLASDHNTALGTLTIGLDSSAGLKVDALFPEITRGLRDAGHRICEFTQLAMDRSARSPRLLASLFHVAYIYAHRLNGLTHLLIEVNPRHVRYYEIMLGFDVISSARHNHRVNAPAVLLSLDLCHAARQIGVFGGRPEMAITERSAYPHFFSLKDELGIVGRLHRSDVDIAHVLEAGPRRAIPSITGPLH